ncbi:MAG: hypothetical protein E7256_07600 [Lachnospiraceae bacterium]|nr:hypothetical protein [Lachnospiraceae bacterium]
MKKKVLVFLAIASCVGIVGCGKNKAEIIPSDSVTTSNDVTQNENASAENNDNNSQVDLMLDGFISGEVEAIRLESQDEFFISSLNMNPEEWDSFSIGEKVDLDNDGENELVINGPYGGMFLDVLNEQIVVFAEGEGTAMELSYVYYDMAYWIVISDTTHAGRQMYTFTKYSGSDNVVDTFELNAEYWEQDEYDENSEFTYRGESISMQQYEELYDDIFGQ